MLVIYSSFEKFPKKQIENCVQRKKIFCPFDINRSIFSNEKTILEWCTLLEIHSLCAPNPCYNIIYTSTLHISILNWVGCRSLVMNLNALSLSLFFRRILSSSGWNLIVECFKRAYDALLYYSVSAHCKWFSFNWILLLRLMLCAQRICSNYTNTSASMSLVAAIFVSFNFFHSSIYFHSFFFAVRCSVCVCVFSFLKLLIHSFFIRLHFCVLHWFPSVESI